MSAIAEFFKRQGMKPEDSGKKMSHPDYLEPSGFEWSISGKGYVKTEYVSFPDEPDGVYLEIERDREGELYNVYLSNYGKFTPLVTGLTHDQANDLIGGLKFHFQ